MVLCLADPACVSGDAVPVVEDPRRAVIALARVATWAERRASAVTAVSDAVAPTAARRLVQTALSGHTGDWLTPSDTAALLREYQVPLAPSVGAVDPESAAEASWSLRFPVVLKGWGQRLVHKSAAGAVVRGLRDPGEVAVAAQAVLERCGDLVEGFLLQPEIVGNGELIVGGLRHERWGHLVMAGRGGVGTDVDPDRQWALAPVPTSEAVEMLRQLVAGLPEVAELDLNPVILTAAGPLSRMREFGSQRPHRRRRSTPVPWADQSARPGPTTLVDVEGSRDVGRVPRPQEDTMTVNARTEPAPVLVGLKDGQEHVGLSWATAEATQRQPPLRILHAFGADAYYPFGYPGYALPTAVLSDIEERLRANALSVLEDALESVRTENPDLAVTTTLARSTAAGSLLVASENASLVVLSRRRHQHPRAASIGSVALAVAAHASCPVVVVPVVQDDGPDSRDETPARPAPATGQVVVGVEDSLKCLDAVGFAFAHASAHGLGLTAVHGWWLDARIAALAEMPDWAELGEDEPAVVDAILAPWRVRYPEVKVSRVVVRQRPAEALVEAGARAGLLVVGSRGRGGFTGLLLGSVSRHVLQHASCPVAVVRAGQLPAADDLDVTAAR